MTIAAISAGTYGILSLFVTGPAELIQGDDQTAVVEFTQPSVDPRVGSSSTSGIAGAILSTDSGKFWFSASRSGSATPLRGNRKVPLEVERLGDGGVVDLVHLGDLGRTQAPLA